MLLILFLVFFASQVIYCNDSSKINLDVKITNIKSNDGNVRIHLYSIRERKFFPLKSEKAYLKRVIPIFNNEASTTFQDLIPGAYAITVHHDENLNEKMDLNFLGLPAEGWGLSKNFRPILSIPSFEDCAINLSHSQNFFVIKMNY